jgi:hypothetical protein
MDVLGPRLGSFRASFRRLWGLSGVLVLVLSPLVLRNIAFMDPFRWEGAAAALASLLLLTPVLVFALAAPFVWLYRVRVHPLGLRAFDAKGRFHSVRWPVMSAAQPLAMLSLPYVRVTTTEAGVELVIPLFLAEREAFQRLVVQQAGPANPLARFLLEPGR